MEGINYHGYIVYDNGKILGKRGEFLKTRINSNGYETVDLYLDGKTVTVLVHILVATCHCHKPLFTTCVHHKNSKKTDNRACNLQWVTQHQNNKFHAQDTDNGHHVFCDDGKCVVEYMSIGDASRSEEVSESHIRYWLNKGRSDKKGKTWSDTGEAQLYI